MADVVSEDVAQGTEVKWYYGGVATQEEKTITTTEASAGGFALASSAKADYGLLVGMVDGVFTAFTGWQTGGTTAATESTGIVFVKYSGITAGDVVVLNYVDINTTTLTHIASCQDVKCSTKADSKKTALHGQATKLVSVGTQESSADLSALQYGRAFVQAVLGDGVTGSPAASKSVWTNKYNGFHKLGCLVGKRYDSSAAVTAKWALVGATPNGLDTDFPTEDYYKDSFKFDVDFLIRYLDES